MKVEIKVGDIVNGYEVKSIDYAWDNPKKLVCYVDDNKNGYITKIKTIEINGE